MAAQPADSPSPQCPMCTKLARALPCCTTLPNPLPCPLCSAFAALLAAELASHDATWHAYCTQLKAELQAEPCRKKQELSDRIDSLKRQAEEVDGEDRRVGRVLEERRALLKGLDAEAQACAPRLEFTFREGKTKGRRGKRTRE